MKKPPSERLSFYLAPTTELTEEIMKNECKNRPVENKIDTNEWRWRIVFQKINLRQS